MDRNRQRWNKSRRMQVKAYLCLLGFLLLMVLLIGKVATLLTHRGDGAGEEAEPTPKPHIPVVEELGNVWVMEADETGLTIFRDGVCKSYPWGAVAGSQNGVRPDPALREQVADVVLTDSRVTSVDPKTEKISGKILGADESGIEVEGYGRMPLAADCKGYRLFGSLQMCTARDLRFGYNFADLCVEEGEICGILMAREEAMEYIRVLLKTSDYGGIFHEEPLITCDVGYTVAYGDYGDPLRESHAAGEEIGIGPDSAYFISDRIRIIPDVLTGKVLLKSCTRSLGTPAYRGQMELLRTDEGIIVINEVPLEEYLYSVVPSEMPAKYPQEALKAQAICARTYAYGHMEQAAFPQYGAHVDDSTAYQVYNNIPEQESATTAVKETYGQLLRTEDGELAGTYYYSTSCGVGSDANVWKTDVAPTLTYLKSKSLNKSAMAEAVAAMGTGGAPIAAYGQPESLGESLRQEENFEAFISAKDPEDFEAQESWYRWNYQVKTLDRERMLQALRQRYDANDKLVLTWKDGAYVSEPIEELAEITDIYVEKRGSGGVVDEMIIEAGAQKIKVISEHCIRCVLCDGVTEVVRQDGSKVPCTNLLPSGFFIISTSKKEGNVIGYTVSGGGYGHGAGMSQNGAKAMAESGYHAMEILLYFYENCAIENVYE